MPDDLDSLDDLLSDGPSASLVDPEIIAEGEKIANSIWRTGCESWGVQINREVVYTEGSMDYCEPSEIFDGVADTYLMSVAEWSGDREGKVALFVPEQGAKEVVAYMMELMMGVEANPETQALDEEGLDAYNEAMRSFFGQAAQTLREDPGGEVRLEVADARAVTPVDFDSDTVFESSMCLCGSGQFTIEGAGPNNVYTLMSPGVTGHELIGGGGGGDDDFADMGDFGGGGTSAPSDGDDGDANRVLDIPVPVSVILAARNMRLEDIIEWRPGSIIEFRKSSEEYLELWAGSVPIADGEVVIIREHFGLQIRKMRDVRAALSGG